MSCDCGSLNVGKSEPTVHKSTQRRGLTFCIEMLHWMGGPFLSADRTQDSSMTGGGGPCVYIHNAWSSNTVKVDGQYSPDFKFLMLRCQPYYLPR